MLIPQSITEAQTSPGIWNPTTEGIVKKMKLLWSHSLATLHHSGSWRLINTWLESSFPLSCLGKNTNIYLHTFCNFTGWMWCGKQCFSHPWFLKVSEDFNVLLEGQWKFTQVHFQILCKMVNNLEFFLNLQSEFLQWCFFVCFVNRGTDSFLYCCDFSQRAVQLVRVRISFSFWTETIFILCRLLNIH